MGCGPDGGNAGRASTQDAVTSTWSRGRARRNGSLERTAVASYRRGITLVEALQMFSTDRKAEWWLIQARWPGKIYCSRCGSDRVRSRPPIRPCRTAAEPAGDSSRQDWHTAGEIEPWLSGLGGRDLTDGDGREGSELFEAQPRPPDQAAIRLASGAPDPVRIADGTSVLPVWLIEIHPLLLM